MGQIADIMTAVASRRRWHRFSPMSGIEGRRLTGVGEIMSELF
jgi:hypothetical protein